eukprot:712276_1
MGILQSTESIVQQTKGSKSEFDGLLSQLNSQTYGNDNDFKIIERLEINAQELHKSLQKMKDNETFQQFETYRFVSEKMPVFVVKKAKIHEPKSEIDYNFGAPQYYDIHGSYDPIKQVLSSFISSDIVDIILQY